MPSQRLSVVKSAREVPLVTFANGAIRKESRKRKLSVGAFKDAKPNRVSGKKRKLLIAESDKMTYRGDNFGPLSLHSQPTQLYVAEVNTHTGKMTMYPAEVFNMHPVTEVDMQREQLQLDSMSLREKSDLLTDAFGSGKQKRALQKRQKNKMAEGVVTSAMGSAIDTAITNQQLQPAPAAQQTSSAIPPYNKDAESPSDVYSLMDIIGPAQIESLKNAAQEFCQCGTEKLKEWRDKNEYYSSVLSRLQVLPMDEERRLRQACLLIYLQYMLTMYHMTSVQIRKRDPLPSDWPDMVKQMMLDRFTVRLDGQRRCIPARLKDLLLSHILVLCLIIDNFTSSLAHLQKDLKVSAKKLQLHSRALGCKVKSESSTDAAGVRVVSYIAMLKIPLSFPEPSKGRKSRK